MAYGDVNDTHEDAKDGSSTVVKQNASLPAELLPRATIHQQRMARGGLPVQESVQPLFLHHHTREIAVSIILFPW
jgi:hypothetical protein